MSLLSQFLTTLFTAMYSLFYSIFLRVTPSCWRMHQKYHKCYCGNESSHFQGNQCITVRASTASKHFPPYLQEGITISKVQFLLDMQQQKLMPDIKMNSSCFTVCAVCLKLGVQHCISMLGYLHDKSVKL